MPIPYLKKCGNKKILVVNGDPVILLAGEVHNSSASSAAYMEPIWQKASELGLNCLLLPVSWAMIEPEEDSFDFTIVDQLIDQARSYNMKIVFLWFGSWKNAECMYAPAWVKNNTERFKRAEVIKGQKKSTMPGVFPRSYTTLSYLCEGSQAADAKAFAALMAHIREMDAEIQTVVAVQVENETGLLGAAREHSDFADEIFSSAVPRDFVAYMRSHAESMLDNVGECILNGAEEGAWAEVFGPVAEEIFSAYHIAKAVEKVAQAGKAEYPLPMLVNCWLNKPNDSAGTYPSGGPVARMHPVWKYCAPSIDVFCPDIYVPYFCDVCDSYTKNGNPLFIPEAATHSYAGIRQVYVIGHHHALGYAPFGIEDMGKPFTIMQGFLFGMDVADPALKTPQDAEEYRAYCKYLKQLMPLLAEKYGTDDLQAVSSERPDENTIRFGDFSITAVTNLPIPSKKNGVCLGLKTSDDSCYLLTNGCLLMPASTSHEKPYLDILNLEEGYFEDGQWHVKRYLNGDETVFMYFEDVTLLRLQVNVYD